MIRIGIAGIDGRMGREIVAAAREAGVDVVGGVVRPGSGRTVDGVRVVERLEEVLPEADVVVDFAAPAATVAHAAVCAAAGRPVVSGTTGLSPEQRRELEACAAEIPLFYARNMSLGLAVLLDTLPGIAGMLAGYDVEIVEAHHRHKTDAPSGTALALAEAIAGATGAALPDDAVFGRQGHAPRRAGEIGLHAVRAGGNPGEHAVILADEGEEVRICHRAFGRRTYAQGALRAAAFVVGRPPGLYGMPDLLAALRDRRP